MATNGATLDMTGLARVILGMPASTEAITETLAERDHVAELRAEWERAHATCEEARLTLSAAARAYNVAHEAELLLEKEVIEAEGRGGVSLRVAYIEAFIEGRHEDAARIMADPAWEAETIAAYRARVGGGTP